jgi:hypothetical protein
MTVLWVSNRRGKERASSGAGLWRFRGGESVRQTCRFARERYRLGTSYLPAELLNTCVLMKTRTVQPKGGATSGSYCGGGDRCGGGNRGSGPPS